MLISPSLNLAGGWYREQRQQPASGDQLRSTTFMTHHFTITPLNTCRRRVAVLLVALLVGWFVATPRQAFASSKTWLLSGTGDWNSGDNWSDGLVPSSSSSAFVDNGGTVNVPEGVSGRASSLYLGYNDTGSLSLDGGYLNTPNGCYLGYNAGSSGTATITSGNWNAGYLYVGNSGAGTLNINGGLVSSTNSSTTSCIGGINVGATGTVTVTSGTWNAGSLLVAAAGAGTLNINGGLVSSTYSSIGKGGPTGTVTVASGTWNAGALYVGNQGAGTLNLTGGLVSSGVSYIGYIYGGNGEATVTSGTWNAGNLTVGDSKKGTLTIGGSGVVNVGNGTGTLTLSASTGSVGTLNMGDGTSVGTLNATSISIGSGTATINFNHTGNYTFDQQFLTGNLGNLSMNNLGSGTTTLTGNAQISSATVSAGELSVSGSLGANTPISVSAGAVLSGSGTVHAGVFVNGTLKGSLHTWTLSGSGLVSPGNSPGIATSINPTGGMSFAFEFTLANTNPIYSNALASGNDILHLTGASPFSDNLTADNLISIYLQSAVAGDSYLGGFFTGLSDAQLEAVIQNAKFAFFVEDDANGTITFNGKKYDSLDATLVAMGTVLANNATFADGTVDGSVLKVTVVPEPCTWWMLTAGMVILIYLKSSWVVSTESKKYLRASEISRGYQK
jgi:T5SS/PEP-CTERM-associated repeat protein